MIIGKFQHEDGVYVGSVPAFTGPSLPIRLAPTDQKGTELRPYPAIDSEKARFSRCRLLEHFAHAARLLPA
jgi:hypothetical protein